MIVPPGPRETTPFLNRVRRASLLPDLPLAPIDMQAIRYRTKIVHPSVYDLAVAFDDRRILMDMYDAVSTQLEGYLQADPNSGYGKP